MSRIESGRLTLKNEEFSLREILEQINTMINSQCQEKGLSYECRIAGRVNDYYIGDDKMKNLKKLTLLHSNDLHGDFLAERVDEELVGGVSRLSGYINKVRSEEKNVIYIHIHSIIWRGGRFR